MKSKVAFVVVGWNNQKLLADCFDSILAQSYPSVSILYVDNGSADESIKWVKSNYPNVIILDQHKNTGFARGNNQGIEQALKDPDVKFVGLLNTDARITPEWTDKIVNFATRKARGACYQGTTFDFYNHSIIDSTHIYVSRNGQGTQGNWRAHIIHEIGPKKVFGVNAAACLISREFIEAQPFGTKLFDETMFMYLEDVDFAVRATVMGWDNYLVAGATAYHMGSVSAKAKSSSFSLYMTFRNNSGMLYKNFPWRILFRMFIKLVRGDLDTIRTLWRLGRKGEILAVLRGRLVGILRLPLFCLKRLKMSRARKLDTNYLWNLMNEGY